jgi:hypothetical protein
MWNVQGRTLQCGRAARLLPALALAMLVGACGGDVQVTVVGLPGAPKLYGADGAQGNLSTLYQLDETTGAVVATIGPIGYAVTGLAAHPTSRNVYGVTGGVDPGFPGHLIALDPGTGAVTLVGDQIVASNLGAADITFTTDGVLYGWSEATDDLVTIDLATGAATVVGDSVTGTAGSGLAARFPGNTLHFVGSGSCGPLFTVDRSTGTLAAGPTLSGVDCSNINALAYRSDGTLYGVRNLGGTPPASELVIIDTATGLITVVGPSVDRLDAIAFF